MTSGFRTGGPITNHLAAISKITHHSKSIDVNHGIEFLICRARESMVTGYWSHLRRGFNIQTANGLRQIQRQNPKPKTGRGMGKEYPKALLKVVKVFTRSSSFFGSHKSSDARIEIHSIILQPRLLREVAARTAGT
jgi:hypothetical protein